MKLLEYKKELLQFIGMAVLAVLVGLSAVTLYNNKELKQDQLLEAQAIYLTNLKIKNSSEDMGIEAERLELNKRINKHNSNLVHASEFENCYLENIEARAKGEEIKICIKK